MNCVPVNHKCPTFPDHSITFLNQFYYFKSVFFPETSQTQIYAPLTTSFGHSFLCLNLRAVLQPNYSFFFFCFVYFPLSNFVYFSYPVCFCNPNDMYLKISREDNLMDRWKASLFQRSLQSRKGHRRGMKETFQKSEYTDMEFSKYPSFSPLSSIGWYLGSH